MREVIKILVEGILITLGCGIFSVLCLFAFASMVGGEKCVDDMKCQFGFHKWIGSKDDMFCSICGEVK